MKFGKTDNLSGIDFSLPTEPERNRLILDNLPARNSPPKIFIGATGWGMKEWIGKWYPKGTKQKDFLKAYGKQFNTIELNTTHYRIPNISLTEKWKSETPEDFVFCPKIPQTISHSREMGLNTDRIEIFSREIKNLEEKLGCCFLQMPPYFKSDRIAVLERFLSEWDNGIPLAIEIRHEDWFQNKKEFQQWILLLEKYNISTVITDVAGRRDVLHMGLTTDIAMIRFVGNGLIPSDFSRIDEWVEKLSHWFENNLKTVYFFTHEPDNILAPDLAVYLADKLKEKIPHAQVRGPRNIEQQISLF